jgi:hypothetical protein
MCRGLTRVRVRCEWFGAAGEPDVLCEYVNIYTPDGRTELIKSARVQFVYGRRYGLIGPNGKGSAAAAAAPSLRVLRAAVDGGGSNMVGCL